MALREPATRAEVIGWSIASPAAVAGLLYAASMHGLVGSFEQRFASIAERLPATTHLVFGLGDWGVAGVLVALALVPIIALLTRQRPWVHVAAPVVFALVAFVFVIQVNNALLEVPPALVAYYEELAGR